ncbi:MAG: SDR family NAD(P)-dependent oxidoreductase [Anaerolineales bacterium]|nr:MAG: SDR family NAD(P)-dependent oxidoreductase [Anaerolineales bacterium]
MSAGPTQPPVILITGASSGIGAAAARRFAVNGYRVALAARRLDRLQALQAEIEAAGGEAIAIQADVSDAASVEDMVAQTLKAYGQVDVLFNNAGFGRTKWLEKLDPQDDIAAQINTNLTGAILAAQAVLPYMIKRRSGHIINMSSVSGLLATPTYSIYAATKFGLRGFSDALRREVGVFGIKVSVIYPGAVTTDFASHTGASRKTGVSTPKALVLTPEQVAQAVLGLARRPRRALIIPAVSGLAVLFANLFPGLTDWLQERFFTRPERGL